MLIKQYQIREPYIIRIPKKTPRPFQVIAPTCNKTVAIPRKLQFAQPLLMKQPVIQLLNVTWPSQYTEKWKVVLNSANLQLQ